MMFRTRLPEGLESPEDKRARSRSVAGSILGGLAAAWYAATYVEWAYHASPLEVGIALAAGIWITFLFAGAMSE